MRKEIMCMVCVLAIILMAALPVSAAPATLSLAADVSVASTTETEVSASSSASSEVGVSVADGVIGFGAGKPTEIKKDEAKEDSSTVSATGLYPFEIQYDTHNGAPIVIKSFRVPAGFDPSALVEEDFEDTGFLYSKKDILKNEPIAKTEQKLVAQTVTFSTEDNDKAILLSSLSPVMDYDEGGFTGQLELDYNSVQSAASGEESYSYPIRKTVEYNDLDNNDYAYLDKNLDGLVLQEADWTPMGGSQRGNEILPGSYNATAVYTGVGHGTRVTGYNNTAIYKGYVTRTFDGESIYSVIYQGTRIKTESSVPWGFVGIGFLILLVGVGATWACLTKLFPMLVTRRGRKPGRSDDVPLEI